MVPRYLLLSIACGLILITAPMAAEAHTRFLMSEPAPDAVLSTAPQVVQLWFSKPVESAFSRIEVKGPDGQRFDTDNVRHNPEDAKILEVGLPKLPPATYHVDWSVVSGDGHRVKGDFSFTVE